MRYFGQIEKDKVRISELGEKIVGKEFFEPAVLFREFHVTNFQELFPNCKKFAKENRIHVTNW